MRYGILMHRIPAHEERKRQQNRKTQISFSVLLPALFFFYSSFPSIFPYSYRFAAVVKQRTRARLYAPFQPLVRNIKISGFISRIVSTYLRSKRRVSEFSTTRL